MHYRAIMVSVQSFRVVPTRQSPEFVSEAAESFFDWTSTNCRVLKTRLDIQNASMGKLAIKSFCHLLTTLSYGWLVRIAPLFRCSGLTLQGTPDVPWLLSPS